MKIICTEKNTTITTDIPSVYLMPDTALLLKGKAYYIPDFSKQVVCTAGLSFKIDRVGKHIQPKFARKYFNSVALSIQFKAIDLQKELLTSGRHIDLAHSYDGSLAISEYLSLDTMEQPLHFKISINQQDVICGSYEQLHFTPENMIVYLSQFFTTKMGDCLLIATDGYSAPLKIGDMVEGFLNNTQVLRCRIK